MTSIMPSGRRDDTRSNHLGNSSMSLLGSQVNAGGEVTYCINCKGINTIRNYGSVICGMNVT